jgi:hypothetical protein
MKESVKQLLLVTALSTITLSAHAEPVSGGLHFVLNGGLTFGGDTVDTATYTNGDSVSIKAGGLVQFGGGGLWQLTDIPMATQLTVNYHVDDATAQNGSATFDRTPIELTFFYTGVDKWRFGAGARFVQSPKYKYHVDGGTDKSVSYKSTTGVLVEVGYGFTQHAWANLRFVSEKYQPTSQTVNGVTTNMSNSPALDGSHIGLNFVYVF